MPKGRWLFLLAVGGLAALIAASALGDITCEIVGGSSKCTPSRDNSAESAGKQADESEDASDGDPLGVDAQERAAGSENVADRSERAEESEAGELSEREGLGQERNHALELAEYDLFAQTAMAVAAWVAVFLTGIGIALLYATLRETAKATEAAARAAIAAEASVEETKRVGEAQARAYLAITDVLAEFTRIPSEFPFRAEIVNTGQSPARQISVRYEIEIVYTAHGAPERSPRERSFTPEKSVSVRNIAANLGDAVYFKTDDFPHDGYIAFLEDPEGVRAQVSGAIQWTDVFDRRQSQKFDFFHPGIYEPNMIGGQPIKLFPGTYADWAAGKSQV